MPGVAGDLSEDGDLGRNETTRAILQALQHPPLRTARMSTHLRTARLQIPHSLNSVPSRLTREAVGEDVDVEEGVEGVTLEAEVVEK